jgi:Bacterial TniB protein
LDGELRRANGRERDRSYLPVVYTTIATATTTNKLWVRLADFVGARELRGSNADERLTDLSRLLKSLGTKFVILDEAQRLNTDRQAGAEVADNIKEFAENLDATMIFAGISLQTAPLFSGENGEQWRRRTRPIVLGDYIAGNADDDLEWAQLVASFEHILPLPLHQKGLLLRNAPYLHHRTGGSLASLSDLITDAAVEAIDLGTEAITVDLLDTIPVDDVDSGDSNA